MMNDIYQLNMQAEEYVYMIALNTKGKVLGAFQIAHGTVNKCMISMREIMIRALLCAAVNIVLVHNHPSGCNEPSREDFDLHTKVIDTCALMNIPLLDNLIIAGNTYFSFKEQGYLKTT